MEEADLGLRMRYQLMMCMGFFDEAQLGYEQADVPRLSTAAQPARTALGVWGQHLAALEAGRTPPEHYGFLLVGANLPEAKVYVDGYYKGCTPATLALATPPAGRTVRVTVKLDGYDPWSTAASVLPEQSTPAMAELLPTPAPSSLPAIAPSEG
jgi:hypothetical protein